MRSFILLSLVMVSACESEWGLRDDVLQGCIEVPWYFDGDGDKWGDGSQAPLLACPSDENRVTAQFTARNGRDCNDADRTITGKVAGACPANLVTGDSSHTGVLASTNEYVVLHAPATPVWPTAAKTACEAWGGRLAVLKQLSEIDAIRGAVSETNWVGFIGISSDGASWSWDGGEGLEFSNISFCGGSEPSPAGRPGLEDGHHGRLALVRNGTTWCLGRPGTSADYPGLEAHFVCQRDEPDPDAFQDNTCFRGSSGEGTPIGTACP